MSNTDTISLVSVVELFAALGRTAPTKQRIEEFIAEQGIKVVYRAQIGRKELHLMTREQYEKIRATVAPESPAQSEGPEYVDEEQQFYDDVKRLVQVAMRTLKKLPMKSPEYQALSEAVGNVEPYFECDDPVQNGWVGSDGRP